MTKVLKRGTGGLYTEVDLQAGASPWNEAATASTPTFDGNGRITNLSETVLGLTRATTYTYGTSGSGAGKIIGVSIVYNGKTRTETHSYDSNGRWSGMTATEV